MPALHTRLRQQGFEQRVDAIEIVHARRVARTAAVADAQPVDVRVRPVCRATDPNSASERMRRP